MLRRIVGWVVLVPLCVVLTTASAMSAPCVTVLTAVPPNQPS